MAARPTSRAVAKLARNVQARQLSMTGPTTFPSAILTDTKGTKDGNATDASKRPQAAKTSSSDGAPPVRNFNTSRTNKMVGDTSTIDFAFLPDIAREGKPVKEPVHVPVLLSTMYSGLAARAMHEDDNEKILRPLINLVAGSSTHISTPSAMSEVLDNNAVDFEGIESHINTKDTKAATPAPSEFKQFFNDVLDDVFGPKRSA